MFNGRIFYTSNLQMISSGYYQGYKLIYIGDSLEMPQDFNFIDGALFTPDYRTISAALEGNDSLLVNNYNNFIKPSDEIIDVNCICYNNPSEIYGKLLYSSFTPQSISIFIDEGNIDKNILDCIMEKTGIYINVSNVLNSSR